MKNQLKQKLIKWLKSEHVLADKKEFTKEQKQLIKIWSMGVV